MPEMNIGRNFGRPIGQPDSYYVRCGTCDRTEGQFVKSTNQLTVGTGTHAQKFIDRGWRFEGGQWICPTC